MTTTLPHLPPVPLLRTKLFPADAGASILLPRSALIERLMAARAHRLVVLSAPAGFGKSTVLSLLRQHLEHEGSRVAWLSCDESDSEPARLLQYLCAAIETVAPTFSSTATGLVASEVNWPVEALIDAFVADLKRLDGQTYLMLDDFHRVRDPALGQAMRYLLKSLPERVHLIVSTRYKPRFINAEQDSNSWAFWLLAEDLRLSRDETAAYFVQIKKIELSPAELDVLQARTEGWITALHLAALALVRNSDRAAFLAGLSGTERNIADYLAEDVLASLPAELQLFLDQTSVLDEFSAELCNALTGRSDGLDMLMRLQGEQLFIIPLDEQGEWFRYHHLFAEFLQGRLARRGDTAALLNAAARWCEARDLPD